MSPQWKDLKTSEQVWLLAVVGQEINDLANCKLFQTLLVKITNPKDCLDPPGLIQIGCSCRVPPSAPDDSCCPGDLNIRPPPA